MNRLSFVLIAFILALASPHLARAQKGLHIQDAFSSAYTTLPDATETLLTRSRLHDVSLSLYRALSLSANPDKALEIERMVLADGRSAISKEVRYTSGHLFYGLYVLPPVGGENRYILFLNGNLSPSGGKMLLLYLEGKASVDDVRRLINKKK